VLVEIFDELVLVLTADEEMVVAVPVDVVLEPVEVEVETDVVADEAVVVLTAVDEPVDESEDVLVAETVVEATDVN